MLRSVIFLRTALGAAAVPQPAINVGSAFEVAADAALGTTLSPGFSPYKVRLLAQFLFLRMARLALYVSLRRFLLLRRCRWGYSLARSALQLRAAVGPRDCASPARARPAVLGFAAVSFPSYICARQR